jgi:hypothetical protein
MADTVQRCHQARQLGPTTTEMPEHLLTILVTGCGLSNNIKPWRFKHQFGLHYRIRSISGCGLLW